MCSVGGIYDISAMARAYLKGGFVLRYFFFVLSYPLSSQKRIRKHDNVKANASSSNGNGLHQFPAREIVKILFRSYSKIDCPTFAASIIMSR